MYLAINDHAFGRGDSKEEAIENARSNFPAVLNCKQTDPSKEVFEVMETDDNGDLL